MSVVAADVPGDVEEILKRIAGLRGCNKSCVIREALTLYAGAMQKLVEDIKIKYQDNGAIKGGDVSHV